MVTAEIINFGLILNENKKYTSEINGIFGGLIKEYRTHIICGEDESSIPNFHFLSL